MAGAGHLRKRGKTWQLIVSGGTGADCQRVQHSRTVKVRTKREAQQALAVFVAEVAGKRAPVGPVPIPPDEVVVGTVGELLAEWFAFAAPELAPGTVAAYETYIRLHVKPALATVNLTRLTSRDLDVLYGRLRDHGLSPATIRRIHTVIRQALGQGVRWGWVATNVALAASPPRVRRAEVSPPTPTDVGKLLLAASERDPALALFLRLAAATGARRGEVCALRWRDVDEGSLLIARSMADPAGLIEKDTKTHASRRVALDGATAVMLEGWRARCEADAAALGVELGPEAHVFSYEPDGGRAWRPDGVTRRFIKLRNRVGLTNVRLHDLRHYVATELLEAGLSARTVAERLGHANASTTLGIYAHAVPAADQAAAEVLGRLLDG